MYVDHDSLPEASAVWIAVNDSDERLHYVSWVVFAHFSDTYRCFCHLDGQYGAQTPPKIENIYHIHNTREIDVERMINWCEGAFEIASLAEGIQDDAAYETDITSLYLLADQLGMDQLANEVLADYQSYLASIYISPNWPQTLFVRDIFARTSDDSTIRSLLIDMVGQRIREKVIHATVEQTCQTWLEGGVEQKAMKMLRRFSERGSSICAEFVRWKSSGSDLDVAKCAKGIHWFNENQPLYARYVYPSRDDNTNKRGYASIEDMEEYHSGLPECVRQSLQAEATRVIIDPSNNSDGMIVVMDDSRLRYWLGENPRAKRQRKYVKKGGKQAVGRRQAQ
jgi:hypothetical protein